MIAKEAGDRSCGTRRWVKSFDNSIDEAPREEKIKLPAIKMDGEAEDLSSFGDEDVTRGNQAATLQAMTSDHLIK